MSVVPPNVIWAQRKDVVHLTIQVTDSTNHSIKLESSTFKFSCDVKDKKYGLELELLHEIEPEESKQRITDRDIYFLLKKKDKDQPFWNTLTKDKVKPRFIKTDFNRWKDEDDSDYEEGGAPGMGGMGDMNLEDMMAKMGGAGGAGFDPGDVPESDDSDDEDIPDLED